MEWILAAVAAVIALPVAIAWFAQEGLIFFPQPLSADPTGPAVQAMEIAAADGTRLRGWIRLARGAGEGPVLIYFGGNAEEVSWTMIERRWPQDWNIVAFNYRGYGASEGKPGEAALVADALAIHDAIALRTDVDRSRIVAFGRSLGTGVAVQLAAQRPLAGVVLASPYASLVALAREHYPFLPAAWLLRHRFDGESLAPGITAPMLTLVAEFDRIVPASTSRALYEAWAGPKSWVVVPGTDHNTLSIPDAFWIPVRQFLAARAS
jgi:hypothetical protein